MGNDVEFRTTATHKNTHMSTQRSNSNSKNYGGISGNGIILKKEYMYKNLIYCSIMDFYLSKTEFFN